MVYTLLFERFMEFSSDFARALITRVHLESSSFTKPYGLAASGVRDGHFLPLPEFPALFSVILLLGRDDI